MFNEKAKYIIIEGEFGVEAPIVFSHLLTHVSVAGGRKVLGAGKVSFGVVADPNDRGYEPRMVMEANCYGESISLGIKSRGYEDDKLIEQYILNK